MTELRIVHGGAPDPAMLAALTTAIVAAAAAGAAPATSASQPAWSRAARLEAPGTLRINHPGELPPGR